MVGVVRAATGVSPFRGRRFRWQVPKAIAPLCRRSPPNSCATASAPFLARSATMFAGRSWRWSGWRRLSEMRPCIHRPARVNDRPAARDRADRAPVAQLDRAPDYESGGQGFESSPVRHPNLEARISSAYLLCNQLMITEHGQRARCDDRYGDRFEFDLDDVQLPGNARLVDWVPSANPVRGLMALFASNRRCRGAMETPDAAKAVGFHPVNVKWGMTSLEAVALDIVARIGVMAEPTTTSEKSGCRFAARRCLSAPDPYSQPQEIQKRRTGRRGFRAQDLRPGVLLPRDGEAALPLPFVRRCPTTGAESGTASRPKTGRCFRRSGTARRATRRGGACDHLIAHHSACSLGAGAQVAARMGKMRAGTPAHLVR